MSAATAQTHSRGQQQPAYPSFAQNYGHSNGGSGSIGQAVGYTGGFNQHLGGAQYSQNHHGGSEFEGEPPLLEELGINFEHIWAKTKRVTVSMLRVHVCVYAMYMRGLMRDISLRTLTYEQA